MIIRKNEIYSVLNRYMIDEKFHIEVVYPPFESRLFTLDMTDFRVEGIIDLRKFDKIRRQYATTDFLRHDLPDFHDFMDVFLSSGVLRFENQTEIDENFELLKKTVDDHTIYIKPIFLGIDTNIAYYRAISRRFRNHFKYVVSSIVVEEIDVRIHSKYSSKMIRDFEGLPYYHIMHEFSNGSVKEARKAKNAMSEVQHIINRLDAFRIGRTTETKDKEIRDREIAHEYRKFSDEINAEVILLTADKDMVFHAQAEQLSSIYFKLPHHLNGEYHIDPLVIPNLIYDLTLIFGILKVGNTILLGEWHGKSSDDYFGEKIRIYNADSATVKDINICRRVTNEFQGNAN